MSRRTFRSALSALAVGALMVTPFASNGSGDGPREPSASAAAAGSKDDPINQVVAVSVDGLRPDVIKKLGSRAPRLNWLIRNSVRTTNARTAYEMTKTMPNHTSMLTGRRIDAAQGGHGVDFNTDSGGTVHDAAGEYVASVFDVVHDRGWSTALYTSKEKLRLFNRSWNSINGAPDVTGVDNGRDKISRFVFKSHQGRLTTALKRDLANGAPAFTLLHYAAPDKAGHRHGWMSPEYKYAVIRTDRQLGRLIDQIRSTPRLRDRVAVILTADHGGVGTRHENPGDVRNFRVPFMVWGPAIPRNTNIYGLNPDYLRPGKSRPTYDGPQPVRNGMVANLALDLLDLRSVPGSELNRAQDLDVF